MSKSFEKILRRQFKIKDNTVHAVFLTALLTKNRDTGADKNRRPHARAHVHTCGIVQYNGAAHYANIRDVNKEFVYGALVVIQTMALTQPKLSDYFASISPLTSRMVEEAKEVICREGEHWNQMNQEEKDLAMDNHFLSSTISSQYENTSTLDCGDVRELTLDKIFPRLKLQRGQETVHYKEGDREVNWVQFSY